MKLTADQRRALVAHLCSRFAAVVRAKSAAEMVFVAQVFGVASLFARVPSASDFLTRWWTTLGPLIYAPADSAAAPEDHLRVLFHELGHVVAFWRNPFDLVHWYLTARGRAELEAEAERGALEGWWVLTGTIPADLAGVDVLRHGYALDDGPGEHDDHADLARDLLEQAATSVRAGVLSTDVGREVATWVRQHAPGALVGTVIL